MMAGTTGKARRQSQGGSFARADVKVEGVEGNATQDSIFDNHPYSGEEPSGLRTRSQAAKGGQRPGPGAAPSNTTGLNFNPQSSPFGQQ